MMSKDSFNSSCKIKDIKILTNQRKIWFQWINENSGFYSENYKKLDRLKEMLEDAFNNQGKVKDNYSNQDSNVSLKFLDDSNKNVKVIRKAISKLRRNRT